MSRILQRLRRREQPRETPCPRCGVPTPLDARDCRACGWDLSDAYHGPVGRHEAAEIDADRTP